MIMNSIQNYAVGSRVMEMSVDGNVLSDGESGVNRFKKWTYLHHILERNVNYFLLAITEIYLLILLDKMLIFRMQSHWIYPTTVIKHSIDWIWYVTIHIAPCVNNLIKVLISSRRVSRWSLCPEVTRVCLIQITMILSGENSLPVFWHTYTHTDLLIIKIKRHCSKSLELLPT